MSPYGVQGLDYGEYKTFQRVHSPGGSPPCSLQFHYLQYKAERINFSRLIKSVINNFTFMSKKRKCQSS